MFIVSVDKNKIVLHGITSKSNEMRDISQRFQLLGMHERTNRRTSIMKSFGWLCDAKNMLILCSKYAKLEIGSLQACALSMRN